MSVICNNCGKDVVYINNRKDGIVKCDPEIHIAYQPSGRKVEVHLKHECKGNNNRTPGEFYEKKDDKEGLRISNGIHEGREDNKSN